MGQRMGRMFRKFFLAFFLAQMLTVLGVGFMIWFAGPEPHLPEPELEWHDDELPPPLHPLPPGAGLAPEAVPPSAAVAPRHHHHHSPGRWLESRRHGFPFLPVGIGLLASALFAFLLARHFAGPILLLRNAFAELGRGNLKLRLGLGASRHPDELESLRGDFDASAIRLEALMEGQRRLLHDVSHEVRSPVARLQLALDLVRQQPQRAEELLGRMEREVNRIDHLVEELLTLSRLEARAYGSLDQPVDLAELIHAIAEDAGFEGEARAIKVQLECPQHIPVRGLAELLHRAIENVVRNALGHSPDGATVRIQATPAGPEGPARVVIEDEGAGVASDDLERMFQPFKRLHAGADGDGHGLGLAITREAMIAHGGRAFAENRAQGGLRVVLEMGT